MASWHRARSAGLILLIVPVLVPYLSITALAQRPVSALEVRDFSLVLLGLTFGSRPNGLHPSAWAIITTALQTPSSVWHDSSEPYRNPIPLPPYTTFLTHTTASAITCATDAQLHTYFTTTLPAAGWLGEGQEGAAHLFRQGNQVLVISETYYWSSTTHLLELTFAHQP